VFLLRRFLAFSVMLDLALMKELMGWLEVPEELSLNG
jgi:hypothetical protein